MKNFTQEELNTLIASLKSAGFTDEEIAKIDANDFLLIFFELFDKTDK